MATRIVRMLPANAPEAVRTIWQAMESSPTVDGLSLGGSRANGYATELSDWDLYVTGNPRRLMDEIPRLVALLDPLAAFWEPLSERAGYMVVIDGPVKVDLFPKGGIRELQPPWEPGSGTLAAVDGHFWDWTLWLGSKSLRNETDLVADELAKMHSFLLGPLGVENRPGSIEDAVSLYLDARAQASRQFRAPVSDKLGAQVRGALRRHGLVH